MSQMPSAPEPPAGDEVLSFHADIKPLFRPADRDAMSFALELWSYDDVVAHAAGVLARVADGTMPCDGAWPDEAVDVLRRWVDSGMPV